MHGNGIYTVSGVEMLGKPIFSFETTVIIPRGVAGAVRSGDVSIKFTPCFPPFGASGDPDELRARLSDIMRYCSITTNVVHDIGITQGSYNITYNREYWMADFEDFLLEKDLSGSKPGDKMGHIMNMFTLHHSICDNQNSGSGTTQFSILISGTGFYAGMHNIINYL